MTREEFVKLTIPDKMEQLWVEGDFISQKVYYDNDISLFAMDDYLIEVFFNRVSNEIVGVEIQENNQILFEYVKDLELKELLK
ncbi:hypothetical protein CNR22_03400 [Sphingobacteriaceae bacterium]|nr:hypothetical protein CNR22_03400 [Sphingobacteriaceae bacterium]